jgi:small nuclear ribonucleoprotein (snRNP)-like protein
MVVGRQSKFLIWINYRVRVTIQDSRMLIGTFLAFDKHMNLVLSDTEEYTKIKAKNPGEVDREKKRSLGLVLLRGENIVSMSAESPPSQNTKKFSEIPNTGSGKSQPIGRGVPVNGQTQAPMGLSGPGMGVGIPNMMQMMPTMGRGSAIPQGMNRMPMPPQMPMGGIPQMGGIRPPQVNNQMIKPPNSK